MLNDKILPDQLASILNIGGGDLQEICRRLGMNISDQAGGIEPEQREAIENFIRFGEFTTRTLRFLTGGAHEPSPQPPAVVAPPTPAPPPKATIFISYRRDDSGDLAGRICDRLSQNFAIFRDIESIPLGVDFRQFISAAVEKCDVMLAIIGRQWVNARDQSGYRRLDQVNDFTRLEIETALRRNIPVIPILIHGTEMPRPNELPESIQDFCFRQGRQIRSDLFHEDMAFLVKELECLASSAP